MTKKEICEKYIELLAKHDIPGLVTLFSEDGKVVSPLYGTRSAKDFYQALVDDSLSSKLSIKGIFEDKDSGQMALYFEYQWTKKDGGQVLFDVVDILSFDDHKKIKLLTIIYDTNL